MLKRLIAPKGATTQHNTILGDVFNYSERGTNILTNIAAITSNAMGDDDEGMFCGFGIIIQKQEYNYSLYSPRSCQ